MGLDQCCCVRNEKDEKTNGKETECTIQVITPEKTLELSDTQIGAECVSETENYWFRIGDISNLTQGFAPSVELIQTLTTRMIFEQKLTKIHYSKSDTGLIKLSFGFANGKVNPPFKGFYTGTMANQVITLSDNRHIGCLIFGLGGPTEKKFIFSISTEDNNEQLISEIKSGKKQNKDPWTVKMTANQVICSVMVERYSNFVERIQFLIADL